MPSEDSKSAKVQFHFLQVMKTNKHVTLQGFIWKATIVVVANIRL